MSYQNNSIETTKRLKRATELSELTGYPRKIADAIVPVITVNQNVSEVVLSELEPIVVTFAADTNELFFNSGDNEYYVIGLMNCVNVANDGVLWLHITLEKGIYTESSSIPDPNNNWTIYPIVKIPKNANIYLEQVGGTAWGTFSFDLALMKVQ
jgi:hypothetical protein